MWINCLVLKRFSHPNSRIPSIIIGKCCWPCPKWKSNSHLQGSYKTQNFSIVLTHNSYCWINVHERVLKLKSRLDSLICTELHPAQVISWDIFTPLMCNLSRQKQNGAIKTFIIIIPAECVAHFNQSLYKKRQKLLKSTDGRIKHCDQTLRRVFSSS